MIIENNLLEYHKIDFTYSTSTITWDGTKILMKSQDATIYDSYHIQDTPCIDEAAECIKRILDAKYEPTNLHEIAANYILQME